MHQLRLDMSLLILTGLQQVGDGDLDGHLSRDMVRSGPGTYPQDEAGCQENDQADYDEGSASSPKDQLKDGHRSATSPGLK